MVGGTVRVTGGEPASAYIAKINDGVHGWTDESVSVGFNRSGSHGRLLERGFHPRGGRTFVPGRHFLEKARAAAEREIKTSVIASIQQGGAAATQAKLSLGRKVLTQLGASVPRRSGRLAGSKTMVVGGSGRGRR